MLSGSDSGSSDNALSSALKSALSGKPDGGKAAAVAGTAGAVAGVKMASKAKADKGKGAMGWFSAIMVGIGTCFRRVRTRVSQGLRTLMRSVLESKGMTGKKAVQS